MKKNNDKSGFTPGPWKASWNGLWQIQTITNWLVAKAWPPKRAPHFAPENVEANAYLIAAAPELYEACVYAIKELGPNASGDRCWDALEKLEEAAKKARGEK